MNRTKIEKKIIGILEEMTGIDVMLQDKLFSDLELTCFELPEMGAKIEEAFSIDVTDNELDSFNKFTTVESVVNYVTSKLAYQKAVSAKIGQRFMINKLLVEVKVDKEHSSCNECALVENCSTLFGWDYRRNLPCYAGCREDNRDVHFKKVEEYK